MFNLLPRASAKQDSSWNRPVPDPRHPNTHTHTFCLSHTHTAYPFHVLASAPGLDRRLPWTYSKEQLSITGVEIAGVWIHGSKSSNYIRPEKYLTASSPGLYPSQTSESAWINFILCLIHVWTLVFVTSHLDASLIKRTLRLCRFSKL